MDPLTLGLIFAAGSAAASFFSGWSSANDAQEEAEAQKKAEAAMLEAKIAAQRAQAERDIQLADAQFAIETENALEQSSDMVAQATTMDEKTTLQESLVSTAYNQSMKQLGTSAEQLAAQEQNAKVGFMQNQSELVAALGASGTRSGSTAAKVLVQNEDALNQDIARARKAGSDNEGYTLASAYGGLMEQRFNIGAARTNANEGFADAAKLASDYSTGGRAVNLYDQNIANRRADLESNIDLQNLAGKFQQDAYDRQIERNQFGFLDAFTSILGGANAGMQFGANLGSYYDKWIGGKQAAAATPINTKGLFSISNNMYSRQYGF